MTEKQKMLGGGTKVPTTPFSARWLNALRNGLGEIEGKPRLMVGVQPAPEETAKIDGAIADLKARLRSSDSDDDEPTKSVALAKVFAAFPSREQSDTPIKLRMDAYFEALARSPGWAVTEACLRVVKGTVAGIDRRFSPTPPQLAEITRAVLSPLKQDLITLERIAEAARQPAYVPPAYAPAWSRTWWSLFHDLVVSSGTAFHDKDSFANRKLNRVTSLAMARVGWKVSAEELAAAEERGKSLVVVMVPSPECDAWVAHFAKLGVNMPVPLAAPVWMPAAMPLDEREAESEIMGEETR